MNSKLLSHLPKELLFRLLIISLQLILTLYLKTFLETILHFIDLNLPTQEACLLMGDYFVVIDFYNNE